MCAMKKNISSNKSLNVSCISNHRFMMIYVYEHSVHEIHNSPGPPLQVRNGNSHWPEANSSRARTCVSFAWQPSGKVARNFKRFQEMHVLQEHVTSMMGKVN